MNNCKICGWIFRDSYNLSKHLARKKPCSSKTLKNENNVNNICGIVVPNEFSNAPSTAKNAPSTARDAPSTAKSTPSTAKNNCKFCLNTFASSSNLKRHTTICKFQDDPVRLLEIENDITPDIPECKTECRFCNHTFARIDNLNKHLKICKERLEYQEKLLKRKNEINNQINNTINNNTINNINNINNNVNVIVLSFGNENLDHIKPEDIISDINNLISENSDAKNYILAGKLLTCFEERVKSIPENKNINLKSIHSDYGELKTETGVKKIRIKRFLENCIKNTAKNFNKKKSQIKTKDHETKSILKEVDVYAEHGFKTEEEISKNEKSEIEENVLDYKYTLINN
jgi:hypothetical protein